MSEDKSSWEEWSRHVLISLDKLNDKFEGLSRDVGELKVKLGTYDQQELVSLRVRREADVAKVKQLEEDCSKLSERTSALENSKSEDKGKWSIVGPIVGVILSAFVGWLFSSSSKAAEVSHEPNQVPVSAPFIHEDSAAYVDPRDTWFSGFDVPVSDSDAGF